MAEKKKTVKKARVASQKKKAGSNATPEISKDLADQLESGEAHLHVENLAQLDITSLTETLQFLEEDSDEFEIIVNEIKRRPPVRIEVAHLGHRVWSYFYDKYLLRLGLVAWLFIAFGKLRHMWPQKITTGPDQSTTVGTLLMIAATAAIILLWRLYTAYQESKLHRSHPGSTYRRSQFGLKVVNSQGQPLGIIASFLRGFFRATPIFLLTLFTMEVGKNNRGIHDRIFGTYVLRVTEDVSEAEMREFIARNY